jgi:hypothetical protein
MYIMGVKRFGPHPASPRGGKAGYRVGPHMYLEPEISLNENGISPLWGIAGDQ